MGKTPKGNEKLRNVLTIIGWIISLLGVFFLGDGIMHIKHLTNNDFSLAIVGLPSNIEPNQDEDLAFYIRNQWKSDMHVRIDYSFLLNGGAYKIICQNCSLKDEIISGEGESLLEMRIEAENAQAIDQNQLCITVSSIISDKNNEKVCHKFEVINRDE